MNLYASVGGIEHLTEQVMLTIPLRHIDRAGTRLWNRRREVVVQPMWGTGCVCSISSPRLSLIKCKDERARSTVGCDERVI